VLQAVKIVSQTQQQGLATLRKQAAAGSAARQFAFGHGEDGFNQRPTTVFSAVEIVSHLSSDAMNGPRLFSAFSGDDAESLKLLADEGVVALGIELGIGQHASHGPAVPIGTR
jgi:hypothetical protein